MSGMGMRCEHCDTTESDRWVMKVRVMVEDYTKVPESGGLFRPDLQTGKPVSIWRCGSCAKNKEWPGKPAEIAAQR